MKAFNSAALVAATSLSAPRALCGSMRAESRSPQELIRDINAGVTDMRTRVEGRIDQVEKSVDSAMTVLAAYRLNGGVGGESFHPEDPDYSAKFQAFVRTGENESWLRAENGVGSRAEIRAAMSVGSNTDGGYLAPAEWDRRVRQAQVAVSPMRRLATVQPTARGAFTTLWNTNAWGSGWVGETAARPETSSTGLLPIPFDAGEIYANVAVTQRLLDDSLVNVETWLAEQVGTEFAKQEGVAFISGNGTNKPRGLLTYVTGGASAATHPGGVLDVVPSGHATTIPNSDVLMTFAYGLAAPYRQNATWLMNSSTAAALSLLKDGQGNYIWRESLIVGQPSTLLGRPVEIDEAMPSIGAGNLAIAFGDFKAGYLINDRMAINILRDPFTNKPFVMFYCTKRVGAGVLDPRAIRLLKISVS